ncbi:ATP-binding protein [Oceanithermus sp.]|uniref:sensor histidine kinase n=1 Tax=Oceanithermus sp. TaxID=2268145 RepID=UPI00257DC379|nr:ATP-binding protein [Oceanithermus sp.]
MNPWRAAWEASEEGVVLFDGERVRYLNPAAARLLDTDPERAAGRPAAFVLRHHRLLELRRGGGAATLTLHGRRVVARALGEALFLRDETETARTREALEQERRFLAHEFRTPVAGLLALLEVLESGPAPEEGKRALALMREEAERLLRLVEGQGQARTPPWRLDELRPRLERLLPGARTLRWSTPHPVTAGRDPVFQVLLNLVENALRYGKPPVEVRTRAPAPGVVAVEVVDAGEPLADYERLFVPGGRGVHAAGVRGSGLGLALVRRIARGWGGEAYGRRLEEGNAFGVTVPEGEGEEDA